MEEKDILAEVVEEAKVENPYKKRVYDFCSSHYILIGCIFLGLIILLNFINSMMGGIGGIFDFAVGNVFNALFFAFILKLYLKAKDNGYNLHHEIDSIRTVVKVHHVFLIIGFSFIILGLLILIPSLSSIMSILSSMMPEYNELMGTVTNTLLIQALIIVIIEGALIMTLFQLILNVLKWTSDAATEIQPKPTKIILVAGILAVVYGALSFAYGLFNFIPATFKLGDASPLINDFSVVSLLETLLYLYFGIVLIMFNNKLESK